MIAVSIGLMIVLLVGGYLIYAKVLRALEQISVKPLEEKLVSRSDLKGIERSVHDVPRQVLDSITGTIAQQKGKLAELVAYMQLQAQYDRLIPLNNIVDFIGITFGTDEKPGCIAFIDIKNGKSARLSDDQKELSKIIESQRIEFIKLKIDTDVIRTYAGTDRDVCAMSSSDGLPTDKQSNGKPDSI